MTRPRHLRLRSWLTCAALSLAASGLSGCAAQPGATPTATAPAQDDARSFEGLAASGDLRLVAISDYEYNDVKILQGPPGFEYLATVSAAAFCPTGIWFERTMNPNLFITNEGCKGSTNAQAYAPTIAPIPNSVDYQPTRTYTGPIHSPAIVTTNVTKRGPTPNLYVGGGGLLVEYAGRTGRTMYSCSISGLNEGMSGVAVRDGRVFVAVGSFPMSVLVYASGLSGCNGAPIGFAFPGDSTAGELLIDRAGDLIENDRGDGSIYIVPPPYTTSSASVRLACEGIALDGAETLIYCTQPKIPPDVAVVTYPALAPYATITPSPQNHLGFPRDVAAW